MTRRTSIPVRRACLVLACGLSTLAAACGMDRPSAPLLRAAADPLVAAKASAGLAVSSTNPSYGDQGTTINVHVYGNGFTAGAQATWLLNGVADDHVHTNSTTFVSASELVANITIAADADLAFWDVQVSLSSGKNGVGSDCFEVTSAEVLGTTGSDVNVFGISEQLQVAGYATGGGFVYDDGAGIVNLGSGAMVMTIDPFGTLVAGKVGDNFVPTAWVRQTAASWPAEQLPQLPHSVGARAQAAARTADGTLLLAGLDDSALSTKPNAPHNNRVVVWRLSNGAWSMQKYELPAGSVAGAARAINGLGQIAGRLDAGATGAVWDDAVTSTRLDGLPNAINPQGTIVVGERSNVAVYWWRDPASNAWHTTGVPLPSIDPACAGGVANDVNAAGVIVGSSCNSDGKSQGTVWLLEFSGAAPVLVGDPTALPGLGTKKTSATDVSSAAAVTEAAPYVVAGGARSNGTRLAVRWRLR